MMGRVELDDVSFSYGADEVVRGVSLSAGAGEVVGLVGPNGAGKSTLIKLMAGVLEPSKGEISLGGRPLRRMRPVERARLVAMVPQESRIPFSYSALEVVLSGRAPHLPAFGFESEADV
nr:ABC transporter ATP-binding protein [bacterium]